MAIDMHHLDIIMRMKVREQRLILANPHRVRSIAVRALTDPRTVRRYLEHLPVRPSLAARICEALRELTGLK